MRSLFVVLSLMCSIIALHADADAITMRSYIYHAEYSSVRRAVMEYYKSGRVGSLEPFTKETTCWSARHYFDAPDAFDDIVLYSGNSFAGYSPVYVYKGSAAKVYATIIFHFHRVSAGTEVRIRFDNLQVVTGHVFSIHSFRFDAERRISVKSTGAEEYLILYNLGATLGEQGMPSPGNPTKHDLH